MQCNALWSSCGLQGSYHSFKLLDIVLSSSNFPSVRCKPIRFHNIHVIPWRIERSNSTNQMMLKDERSTTNWIKSRQEPRSAETFKEFPKHFLPSWVLTKAMSKIINSLQICLKQENTDWNASNRRQVGQPSSKTNYIILETCSTVVSHLRPPHPLFKYQK